jgi:hypothetical protein
MEDEVGRTFPTLESAESCPHMAALIKSVDELPQVLARFYRLGASRNGWLAYTARPGESATDRARLAEAGLDVDGLEASGRFIMAEIDLTLQPADWIAPWMEQLTSAVQGGFDAMWFARFPIAPGQADVTGVRPFEAMWMARFSGQKVVTLCPYVVSGLDEAGLRRRITEVGQVHDEVHIVADGRLVPVT